MAKSRKKKKNILPVVVVLAAAAILLTVAILTDNRPSKEEVDLKTWFASENGSFAVIRDNILTHEDFLCDNGVVYTSLTYLQEKLNKRFYFDEAETLLLYTLPSGTVRADALSVYHSHPVIRREGAKVYILLDYAAQYTAVSWKLAEDPNRLILRTRFGERGGIQALTNAVVRQEASVRSPIMTRLEVGETADYLQEQAEWDYICTEDGILGYVAKEEMSEPVTLREEIPYADPVFDMVQTDDGLCVVWHQIDNTSVTEDNAAMPALIARTAGVTTISPTWLFIENKEGGLVSYADRGYVEKAHELGLDVWVLINNMEYAVYGDALTSLLSVTSKRTALVEHIVSEVLACGADGVNVDIESLPADAGRAFIQFIRELSLACHKEGLVLSVDNYVPSAWTAHYDRAEQGIFADYVIIMGYDEHYAGGAEAGSTASLAFVTKGVEDTLAQVPAGKVINGVPFYTRLWLGSGDSLSSSSLSMPAQTRLIEDYALEPVWDSDLGQYYAEFTVDGKQARVWFEDAESMEARLNNLQGYQLAGLAAWKLGMESPSVWVVISNYFAASGN